MADWASAIPAIAGLAGQLVNAGYTEREANRIAEEAYAKAQANLTKQRSDFEAIPLPEYGEVDVNSVMLPKTGLSGIQEDPRGRVAQEQYMAQLQELADNGGLSLADMKALNDIQANLNRSAGANRKAIENQFAARGQLGSGAQLAMELSGAQDAAMRANDAGESAAAQAQARALQALAQRGSFGRQMSNDDYSRKSDAAKAQDLINARNASARVDVMAANNRARGAGFNDRMNVAKGKNAISDNERALLMDQGRFRYGNTKAEGAMRADAINQGIGALGGLSGGGGGGRSKAASDTAWDNDSGWGGDGEGGDSDVEYNDDD